MARRVREAVPTVRYAGSRWRIVQDRGRWLIIARGHGEREESQWVPAGSVKRDG